jgi:hypothetical protein
MFTSQVLCGPAVRNADKVTGFLMEEIWGQELPSTKYKGVACV